MHLFRSVFIVAAAAIAFVATEAPQASAFILPMTRYMLDVVPDGAEAPDGDATIAPDGSATANVADNISTDTDVPVAVDIPAVAESQEQIEDAAAASVNDLAASSTIAAIEISSAEPTSTQIETVETVAVSSAIPAIPSVVAPDHILAQANAANHVAALGGPGVLIGSMVAALLFVV
ncbi:hypothetical protein BC628DRAFT_1396125 [Trametes gibbosa]|nr:hypothetical protein BC628DRAFT_1396125 [Trametes gibbosa]